MQMKLYKSNNTW